MVTEFLYNQGRNLLGPRVLMVFPLAFSVFLTVLVANWVKLIPGYESVGIIACAEPGQPGYPIQGQDDSTPGILLRVDTFDLATRAGTKATIDNTHACEEAYPEFTPPLVEAKRARGEPVPGEEEHSEGEAEHSEGEDHSEEEATPGSEGAAGDEEGEPTPETTPAAGIAPASFVPIGAPATNAAEEANPDLFVVIPFFRGLATDLNFPLALAIIVVIAVQIWGVRVLGPAYFFKFINIPALGNLSKKPMGAMDFVVGLVEIISELSRLVSLSFRLFGNIFAGGTLLIVMTFLVAGLLPVPFYFLELFVALIQAYVFATLTMIYASQAITAHHGDDDEHHEEQVQGGSH
jgi:F0F1-type ATP synthase membrane subunit a